MGQVNKYYPPDFDPKKHGNLNAYHGTHALRERARKIDRGIIIIRFEMPFNVWCNSCNNHVGMGVRYNAEKTKTGNYFSTTIYRFKMKCHLCDNYYEIQTDPKNLDYEIISGCRRQDKRWDPTKNEQVVPETRETSNKLAADPMFKLDHEAADLAKFLADKPRLEGIQKINHRMRDDFACNQLLRKGFRVKRKELKLNAESDKKLLKKSCLAIKLLPESEKDVRMAKLLKQDMISSCDEERVSARTNIINQSVFKKSADSMSSKLDLVPQKEIIVQAVEKKRAEDAFSVRDVMKDRLRSSAIVRPSATLTRTSNGTKRSLVADYSDSDE